uniref:DUF1758 domain-containing protein n=1 Tax=Haemonchus contortus TaxID=6289 RepID=A0A7I5E7B9_HAECO
MKHILFTKLAQLPACDPEGRQLPTLYNRMFSLVRQFCNGGDDSKETALGALLLNKLPVRVRSQIYDRTSNSHNVTPSELLHLLTDIVRKDSTLFEIEFHTRRSIEAKNVDYGFHSTTRSVRPPSNGTITRSTEKQHNPKKTGKSCPYCKSAFHGAMDCNVFTTTKQRWAQTKVLRLCHNCLSSAHITRECPSKYSCRYCSQRHHSSLCRQFEHQSPLRNLPSRLSSTTTNNQAKKDQQQHFRPSKLNSHTISVAEPTPERAPVADISERMKQDATNPATITYSSSQLLATASPTSQAALMCAKVSLFNPSDPSKSIAVTAFLDSGSSKSYITDEVADRLNLDTITMEDIVVSTFGSTSSLKLKCGNHNVGMVTTKGPKHLQVKSVPTITGNLLQIQINQKVSSGNFTFSQCKPSILIGNDYFWDVVLSDDFFYRRLPNGYRLLHTTIGDVIINEALDFNHVNAYTSVISNETDLDNPRHHDELCELVSNFWKLETTGITDDPTKSDDDECLNYFNDTITYDQRQNRYFVKLPFKSDPAQLPNNFSLAFSRLRSQVKSLQQRPDYLEKYHAVIKNQAELGIIEEVPSDHLSKPSHYLSHHGVVKKDGNDIKIRCVYDGSAKVTGQSSLNDILYRGPVLLPDLTGILLRSRFQKILISSDIEKAFLMVGLNEESRDFTRFLWLKDPSRLLGRGNIITYRFTRVPFGLVSSPFLLAGTIHYHLSSTATPLSHGILRNTYVDNVFQGVNTIEEGQEFYKLSKKLFQRAGMNLRAYVSNSRELNKYFETNEHCKASETQKLLGLQWNTVNDTIFIRLPDQPTSDIRWTNRKVLKCIASIYDPLGLISPTVLIGKLFLQSLWKIELSWDELIPAKYVANWKRITSSWNSPGLCVPRRLFNEDENTEVEYDLHVFTDASAAAYCATAYIVQKRNNGSSSASLIMSKSRLAPLNHAITIPRLELAAMMIGSNYSPSSYKT